MAYIPPHKRSLKGQDKELDREFLSPNFDLQPKLKKEILYTESSILRCFPVGLMENGEFPCSVAFEPYTFEHDEYRKNQKSFVLRSHTIGQPRDHDRSMTCPEWRYVSEKIQSDVLAAVKTVRNLIESDKHYTLKPIFVARVGKVIFHSKQSLTLEKIRESFLNEFDHKTGVKKIFHTAVTNSYMNFVETKMVQENDIALKEEKDQYVLKLEGISNSDCILACKCSIKGDGRLELQKIEANPLRHLVVDLACICEDHDLRIMLTTKQRIESLTAEEKSSIMKIIESAVVDSNVKGGLRWPLGKEYSGDKFRVHQVFHVVSKSFVCPTMRIKLRNTDRFYVENSFGELACEVNMKLMELSNHLKEPVSDECTKEALEEVLKRIWENFVHCET